LKNRSRADIDEEVAAVSLTAAATSRLVGLAFPRARVEQIRYCGAGV
jgi:hypothetical protein